MKNLTLALVLCSSLAYSQGVYHSGARFGIGQSEFNDAPESDGVLHLQAGFVSSYTVLPWLSLSAEALLNKTGGEYSGTQPASGGLFSNDEAFTEKINVVGLHIPVYPTFSLGVDNISFTLHAGAGMNFNLLSFRSRDFENENREDEESLDMDDMETFNFTVLYGGGVKIKAREKEYVFLDFRLNQALSSFYTTEDSKEPAELTGSWFSISAGYLF